MGEFVNTHIVDTFLLSGKTIQGSVSSPWFGPVKNWKHLKWDSLFNNAGNTAQHYFDIFGKDVNENEYYLGSVYNSKDTSLSFINASVFPRLKITMNNIDEQKALPNQLKFWMLTADNYPEGALSPNLLFQCADTLTTKDTLQFRVAFKNISHVSFDSIAVNLTITDVNGNLHVYSNLINGARIKPLISGDTAIIYYNIPMTNFAGTNQVMLEVNPDNDQPEQFHFNNVLYKNIYVIDPVCPGSTISFSVTATTNAVQWQVDTGSGFTDIINNTVYSGVQTNTLSINNAPTGIAGYKYRCIITGSNSVAYSEVYILKFTAIWNGTVSTAWEDNGNWDCGILPDEHTDVIIRNAAPNYPLINSNASCRSLTASELSSITVIAGFNLLITGK